MQNKIDTLHRWFNRKDVKITNLDYTQLIKDDKKAVLFLDPPYYVRGREVYLHHFEHDDHERLCQMLKDTNHHWVLTYDNSWIIRRNYEGWTTIKEVKGSHAVRVPWWVRLELLITPK